jgi:pimeloyl-ACP methyl ester carboxylesterase
MTTKTVLTSSRPTPTSNSALQRGGLLRRIGIALLTLLGILVALIIALPVPLLFLITAVPLVISVMLVLADIGLVIALLRLERTPAIIAAAFGGIILVSMLAVWLSQTYATTPPITDADGNPIPGSIAVMETVNLSGTDQWITIRGRDVHNPVLLFLAGGPGGSELVMTRKHLGELEKHFVVVNWDQPGTGKSYGTVDMNTLTLERFVADGFALTQHLRKRFQQDKIYVLGESWGSILGIWLMQEYPELFHALVTTGQMVAPVENDIQMYEFAIERLTDQRQQDAIERLERNGPPPYERSELLGHFMAINGVVNEYMDTHARGEDTGQNLMLDSLAHKNMGWSIRFTGGCHC